VPPGRRPPAHARAGRDDEPTLRAHLHRPRRDAARCAHLLVGAGTRSAPGRSRARRARDPLLEQDPRRDRALARRARPRRPVHRGKRGRSVRPARDASSRLAALERRRRSRLVPSRRAGRALSRPARRRLRASCEGFSPSRLRGHERRGGRHSDGARSRSRRTSSRARVRRTVRDRRGRGRRPRRSRPRDPRSGCATPRAGFIT
jgi:hypothetical protein